MKKVLLILFISALSLSAFAQTESKDTTVTASDLANMIIKEAESHLGKPYKYGARGPKAFDCSGFTSYVYAKFGYTLGRSSSAQAIDGTEVSGTLSDLQKGDLVLFSGRKKGTIGHVAIFMDYDESDGTARFIHADKAGVRISYFTEPYYEARLMGARRLIPEFVGRNNRRVGDYPYNTSKATAITPDNLTLDAADQRIVIFEKGRWALVDKDGNLSVPWAIGGDRIILYPNGTWKAVAQSTVVVPALTGKIQEVPDVDEAAPEAPAQPAAAAPAATQQKAAATTTTTTTKSTAAASDAATEKVYHTIVQGDTLYELSKKYKVSIAQICRLNNINENTILSLGRKLRIK